MGVSEDFAVYDIAKLAGFYNLLHARSLNIKSSGDL